MHVGYEDTDLLSTTMEEYNVLLSKAGHDNADHCWSWSLTLHYYISVHYNNWIFNDIWPQAKRN
jgi:hypothetical protein